MADDSVRAERQLYPAFSARPRLCHDIKVFAIYRGKTNACPVCSCQDLANIRHRHPQPTLPNAGSL
ncbi:uncharacterized protein B0I36DRAFT_326418 [Microdochium trichocladiopsis]|uniref:Uncharacterized protein n=1 Tax=Microdochium trichocladiopsis TaxID=1682393 RepID=A0A9P9BTH1_9PEZI|nr:uncharacterized protein B0I36DRAFT_326418 [Microdochium trichocladiopsis]KAH7029846.1 hypothetical protein B0I36DRAFT_326418 [Microdochium trichocladiopsis]